MNPLQKKKPKLFLVLSLSLTLSLIMSLMVGCFNLQLPGTETGNAMREPDNHSGFTDTFSETLGQVICDSVSRCFSQSKSHCYRNVLAQDQMTRNLGLDPFLYPTLFDVRQAEIDRILVRHQASANFCLTALSEMECDHPLWGSLISVGQYSEIHQILSIEPRCQTSLVETTR